MRYNNTKKKVYPTMKYEPIRIKNNLLTVTKKKIVLTCISNSALTTLYKCIKFVFIFVLELIITKPQFNYTTNRLSFLNNSYIINIFFLNIFSTNVKFNKK